MTPDAKMKFILRRLNTVFDSMKGGKILKNEFLENLVSGLTRARTNEASRSEKEGIARSGVGSKDSERGAIHPPPEDRNRDAIWSTSA